MNRKDESNASNPSAHNEAHGGGPSVHQRLDRAFYQLQDIRFLRSLEGDPLFGRAAEQQLIWRELVELELQYVDEEIERITAAAGETSD